MRILMRAFNLVSTQALALACAWLLFVHASPTAGVETSGAHLSHLLADSLRSSCSALEKESSRKLLNGAAHDIVNSRVAEALHEQRRARSLLGEHMQHLDTIPTYGGSKLFADAACILQPEAMEGPYWVNGQKERTDITEGQKGVPLSLMLQVVDVNTCLPAEGVFLEIWHCNATGLYSGVQGELNSANDSSILEKNWLRGGSTTDKDGIALINTIFPGHYPMRVTHIHLAASDGLTKRGGPFGNAYSVGQLYFDDDLVDNITALHPYSTNTVELYHLDDDFLFEAGNYSEFDPVVKYAKMGKKLEDGVFAWIRVGVDLNSTYELKAANSAGGGDPYPLTREVFQVNEVISLGNAGP